MKHFYIKNKIGEEKTIGLSMVKRLIFIAFLIICIQNNANGQTPGSIGFACDNNNMPTVTTKTVCEGDFTHNILSCEVASCETGQPEYCWWRSVNGAPFTQINGATNSTYMTNASSFNGPGNYTFKRCLSCDGTTCNQTDCSNEVTVVVFDSINYGEVQPGNQTICNGTTPDPMTVSGAKGSGSFSYQWYYRDGIVDCPTGSSITGWISLGTSNGANTVTYTPPAALTSSRTYAVFVTPGGNPTCGQAMWATGCRQVTVLPNVNPDITISTPQPTVCEGTSVQFTSQISGGGNSPTYQWQLSTNQGMSWTNVGMGAMYTNDSPVNDSRIRCILTSSETCANPNRDTSNVITITVDPTSVAGSILNATTICNGSTPPTLILSGNTGSVQKWQSSQDGVMWNDINNTNNSQMASNTNTTYYRTIVKSGICPNDTTSAVINTVQAVVQPGTISGVQTICTGGTPNNIINNTSGTGSGTISYQWERSADGANWQIIAGQMQETLSSSAIGALDSSTFFRRRALSIQNGVMCSSNNYSNVVKVTVTPQPQAGAIDISPDSIQICAGTMVSASLRDGTGGTGAVTATRQYSLNGSTFLDYTNDQPIPTDSFEVQGGKVFFRNTYSTNGIGCQTSVRLDSIRVNPLPQPMIWVRENSGTTMDDKKVCKNDTITLFADITNEMRLTAPLIFTWSNNMDTRQIEFPMTDIGSNQFRVTVRDGKNCSKASEFENVVVFDLPLISTSTTYDPNVNPIIFDNTRININASSTLSGITNSTFKKYEWEFNPPLDGVTPNTAMQNNLTVPFTGVSPVRVNYTLKVTNVERCSAIKIEELDREVRNPTDCFISISKDNQNQYTIGKDEMCITQEKYDFYATVINIVDGVNLIPESLSIKIEPSDGASVTDGPNLATIGSKLNSISFTKPGNYRIIFEANTNLVASEPCHYIKGEFTLDVFDLPEISMLEPVRDTICQDRSHNYELKFKNKTQSFSNNKIINLIYSINDGVDSVYQYSSNLEDVILEINKAEFQNIENSTIKLKRIEINDLFCTQNLDTLLNIKNIQSCNCNNIFSGNSSFSPITPLDPGYCDNSEIRLEIKSIKIDPIQFSQLSSPKVNLYFRYSDDTTNLLDSIPFHSINLDTTQESYSYTINDFSVFEKDRELYFWYSIAPRANDATCNVLLSPTPRSTIIRSTPSPKITYIPREICRNSQPQALLAQPSDDGSVNKFSYEWINHSNSDFIYIDQNPDKPEALISLDKQSNLDTVLLISFTQTNTYDDMLTCSMQTDVVKIPVLDASAPDVAAIVRYPGDLFFLEDTTQSNLCIQWGYNTTLPDGTVQPDVLITASDPPTPYVSKSGYALFTNGWNLLPDIEDTLRVGGYRAYLWADLWFEPSSECNYNVARCINRSYYNAALPPKGAPRSTDIAVDATVMPNPNNGIFTVQIKGHWTGKLDFILQDALGRLLMKKNFTKNTYFSQHPVQYDGLLPGMYFMTITNEFGGISTEKIFIH